MKSKNEKIIGYIEFLDKRGLTPKYIRAKEIHKQISEINSLISHELINLGVKIVRNPTTIISDSNFGKFEDILKQTFAIWEEESYPFKEELFVRSGTFKNIMEYSMPLTQIPITTISDTSKILREVLSTKLENPDQISLHPRLSTQHLIDQMMVARFSSLPAEVFAEFGYKGVEHISHMENAENLLTGNIKDKILIDINKGSYANLNEDTYKRILLAGKIFSSLADEIIVPTIKNYKPIVYEFQIIEKEGFWYMIFNDFEVI